jgi:hypothetical protein
MALGKAPVADSFETYLASRIGKVNATSKAALRRQWSDTKFGGAGMLSSYRSIVEALPHVRHDLRAKMSEYAERYAPALVSPSFESSTRHLVVHYRMGDFLSSHYHSALNHLISVDSLVDAVKQLAPTVIEIMDGGAHHADGLSLKASRALVNSSQCLRGMLRRKLRHAVPLARLVQPPDGGTSDADFFRMAKAPMLLTATGSFALAAAVAASGLEVRTPAVDDLFMPKGAVEPSTLAANWQSYRTDVWSVADALRRVQPRDCARSRD